MSRLLLVKHALPGIVPDLPAKGWRLGEEGKAQSRVLAEALRPYKTSIVITSDEPKAEETGRIVAEVLELPYSAAPGLHEQDNTGTPYFESQAAFEAAVRVLFAEPEQRVYGIESAHEALQRFTEAVDKALEPHPEKNVTLVAHGRINTLFVASRNDISAFEFWKSWSLATFAVLSRPEYKLLAPPEPIKPQEVILKAKDIRAR